MKITAYLLSLYALLGCGGRRTQLDAFETVTSALTAKGCHQTRPRFDADAEHQDDAHGDFFCVAERECPCSWTASVKKDSNDRASLVRFHVWHCAAPDALQLANELLATCTPKRNDVDLGTLQASASARRVSVRDSIASTSEWHRDAFEPPPGTVLATGSFAVTIRPAGADDKPASSTSEEAQRSAWPACARGRWAPADDMVSIPGGAPVGAALRCQPSSQTLPGFQIQRDVVGCDAYAACVHAGACPDQHEACRHDAAVVGHAAASAFCTWRHAVLPSFAEWQRAIRGADARLYPTGASWVREVGCAHPTIAPADATNGAVRCRNTSSDGVVYYVLDPNEIEWTRDEDCVDLQHPAARSAVGVNVYIESLDREAVRPVNADYGQFRCARPSKAL